MTTIPEEEEQEDNNRIETEDEILRRQIDLIIQMEARKTIQPA
jgi:hypothetical protein